MRLLVADNPRPDTIIVAQAKRKFNCESMRRLMIAGEMKVNESSLGNSSGSQCESTDTGGLPH